MTEAEIEKKWENTPWDTDIYLDDIDEELKPCPFCGGEAKTGRIFGHETVFCTECDACILPSPYNSFANTDKELDESIKMWNKRVVAE